MVIDLLFSDGHLVTGIEDDPDGSLRVYLGARHKGIHTHVEDAAAKDEVRRAWAANSDGHLTTRVPNEALCDCDPGGDPDAA